MNEKEYQEKRYGKEAPIFLIREATAAGIAVARYGDSINIAYPESRTRRGRIGEEIAQTLLTNCEQVVICERNERKEINNHDRATRNKCYRFPGNDRNHVRTQQQSTRPLRDSANGYSRGGGVLTI